MTPTLTSDSQPRHEHAHGLDPLLRLHSVLKLIPVSRSAWYEGVRSGRFPKGVRISARTVAWRESEIRALIDTFVAVH